MSEEQSQLAKLPETYFDGKLAEIAKVIPANTITAEALCRIVITSMNRMPDLRACSPESIAGCLFDISTLGLMPNTPRNHAWLIPRRIKIKEGNFERKVLQCTLQIGYLGFCELAYRTNQVRMIQSDVVRDGDEFRYAKGAGDIRRFVEHIKLIGKGRSTREILGAWASVEMMNGGHTIDVADQDDLFNIKRIAIQFGESPAWKYHEEQMYRKIPTKRMLKHLQVGNMDIIHKAIEIDNKAADLIPINGIDKPAPAEHKLVLTDEDIPGATFIETSPAVEPEPAPADSTEHEYTW